MNLRMFSEIVFDLTTVAENIRNNEATAEVDSREEFNTIYELAIKFEQEVDPMDEDYFDKIEQYGRPVFEKLYEVGEEG